MKKLFSMVFLFTVILFVQNSVVNADDFMCSYYTENGLWNLTVRYQVSNNDLKTSTSNTFSDQHGKILVDSGFIMDFDVAQDKYNKFKTLDEKKKELINLIDGRCQKQLLICKGTVKVPQGLLGQRDDEGFAILFDMQYQVDAKNYSGVLQDQNHATATDFNFSGNNDCWLIDIIEDESTGKIVDSISDNCEKFDEYFGENGDKNLKDLYNKCNKDSEKDACTKYNSYKNEIQSYCSLTVQYGDYQNACVHSCVNNLNEEIYNIEQITSSGDCNVSNRIINWIANIMKWMKYIAPVLVIILSMVDFIKAIASNSDEEVKKTQGKFVKRLIAAALLFIIPFIIQFALETFKLTTDYCGLI